MNTTTKTYFYQSAIVNYVEVDPSNPLHTQLYEMIISQNVPSKEATALMKKIKGFKPSISLKNTTAWSSDLFIMKKDNN